MSTQYTQVYTHGQVGSKRANNAGGHFEDSGFQDDLVRIEYTSGIEVWV